MVNNSTSNEITIGLFLDELTLGFQKSFFDEILSYCKLMNIKLITLSASIYYLSNLTDSVDLVKKIVKESIIYNSIDGLIIMAGAMAEKYKSANIEKIIEFLKPIPVINLAFNMSNVTNIEIDHYQGIKRAIDHLIFDHNIENIGFIRGPVGHKDAEKRLSAFKKYMVHLGFTDVEKKISSGGFFIEETGKMGIEELLKTNPGLKAVIACSDSIAIGAIDYLHSKSIQVPFDFAVIGFDNSAISDLVSPKITTVSQNFKLQSEHAVDTLLSKIKGSNIIENINIEANLVIKESCGCYENIKKRESCKIEKSRRVEKILLMKLKQSLAISNNSLFLYEIKKILEKNSIDNNFITSFVEVITDVIFSIKEKKQQELLSILNDSLSIYYDFIKVNNDKKYHKYTNYLHSFNKLSNLLFSTTDLNQILEILKDNLKYLDIKHFMIVINEETILNKTIVDETTYTEKEIVNSFYFPLAYNNIYFGFISFLYKDNLNTGILENLVCTISKAIYGCIKIDSIKKSSTELSKYFLELSNEIKTPLTIISNILNDTGKDGLDINVARKIVKKLIGDINSIFDYEKLIRGEHIYNDKKPVNISKTLKNRVRYYYSMLKRNKIKVFESYEEELFIFIDPDALSIILNNLIDNSIRFNIENGFINITLTKSKNKVILTITNSGEKIPSKDRLKIFKSYTQLKSPERRIDGIGLGLSLVNKIVKQYNGKIILDETSEHNTFKISFPYYAVKKTDLIRNEYGDFEPKIYNRPNLTEAEPKQDKRSILIIDNNKQMLSFYNNTLSDYYNVNLSLNVDDAMNRILDKNEIDLIIIEIGIGNIDIITKLENFRLSLKKHYIPFLVVSGRNDIKKVLIENKGVAYDYLLKPFDLDELILKIDSINNMKYKIIESSKNEVKKRLQGALKKQLSVVNLEEVKYNLTDKEKEIIKYLKKGLIYKEIAENMGITQNTVKSHVFRIYKKCKINNKIELYNLQI